MNMRVLLQDIRCGLRIQTKAAGFTLVAVLTLALGMGASAAVFSVVNTIMLKPLPYADSEKIVIPWRLAPAALNLGYAEIPWGLGDFRAMLRDPGVFQSLGAYKSDSFNLTGVGDPARIEGVRTSAGFFTALGVVPILGRTCTPEEDQPGREHEVVLSYALWQERFGADPGVLGRSVDLNGAPYIVTGVMPSGFAFPKAAEM